MYKFQKLVVLTTHFPDKVSFESNFLAPELPYLLNHFKEVHLVPSKRIRFQQDLPDEVQVCKELSEMLGFPSKLKMGAHLFHGFSAQRRFPSARNKVTSNKNLLGYFADQIQVGMASRTYTFLRQQIEEGIWAETDTLFYSYWSKYTAVALSWLKQEFPNIRTITRAHRGDLYSEEAPFQTVTRQTDILAHLDRIYSISQHGADYLKSRYSSASPRIQVSRLGTLDPGGRTKPSPSNQIRLVSCSRAAPVKRLSLIAKATSALANHDKRTIIWRHYGDGPELKKAMRIASSGRVQLEPMGDTPLNEIIAAYVSTPFDVFINTSRSEGIPVSLMEAMSCGIPCIAPKVGGIPELIDGNSGGKLISSEARPEEIVSACLEITASESEWRTRSEAAFTKWREDYDASKNLAHFAQIISKI